MSDGEVSSSVVVDDGDGEEGVDEDDDVLMDDDDIWDKLTGDAGGGAADGEWGQEEAEEETEGEQERGHGQADAQSTAGSVWAAIKATAAKGVADVQPPRLGAPRRVSIPAHRLKHATARQVFASSQFNQMDKIKADAFFKRWQVEHKAHCQKVQHDIDQRKAKDDAEAKKKADRLALQQARHLEKEAELAAKRDTRGFDQLLRQGAVKEKAEARFARGQGVTFIVPSEEIPDKKAGILPKIRIGQLVPTIKISAKVMQKASALLSAKAKPSKARAEDPFPYFRVFNKRERK